MSADPLGPATPAATPAVPGAADSAAPAAPAAAGVSSAGEQVPPLTGWQQVYRALAVAGMAGLAAISAPVAMDVVGAHPAAVGVIPGVFVVLILAAAAHSQNAHARVAAAAIGLGCAVLAIYTLLPLTVDPPWEPVHLSVKLRWSELFWRVALGPSLFAFAACGAVAWCGAEFERLEAAAGRRREREPAVAAKRPAAIRTPFKPSGAGALKVLTALPVVAFGLMNLSAVLGCMCGSSYRFPGLEPWAPWIAMGAIGFVLYGVIWGRPFLAVLCTGISAALATAYLTVLGINLTGALARGMDRTDWQLLTPGLLGAAFIAGCLWAAVELIPALIPTLLPPRSKAAPPPEEDLGGDTHWDEAGHNSAGGG